MGLSGAGKGISTGKLLGFGGNEVLAWLHAILLKNQDGDTLMRPLPQLPAPGMRHHPHELRVWGFAGGRHRFPSDEHFEQVY